MTRLQRRTRQLARSTERQVRALWEAHRRGRISLGVFKTAAAAAIARARAQGVALADLAVAVDLSRQRGIPVAPIGLTLGSELARLTTSVETVLDLEVAGAATPEELAESRSLRLGRLARDASAEALVVGVGRAMVAHAVTGWTRATDADPCPLCSRWADGRIRPPTVAMARHTGCSCVQRWVA